MEIINAKISQVNQVSLGNVKYDEVIKYNSEIHIKLQEFNMQNENCCLICDAVTGETFEVLKTAVVELMTNSLHVSPVVTSDLMDLKTFK